VTCLKDLGENHYYGNAVLLAQTRAINQKESRERRFVLKVNINDKEI